MKKFLLLLVVFIISIQSVNASSVSSYFDKGEIYSGSSFPVDVAKKQLPSAIVLAVDVIGNYEKQVETGKLKIVSQILNMSTLYMTDISKSKKSKADIKLTITQPEIKQMDFNSKSAILAIRNGKNAMERNIKKLKELLEI